MPTLQEQQAPLDAAIVNAMIESTPETWTHIVLTLSRSSGSGAGELGNFSHELSSPEGHPPVAPADSLFDATYALDELIQRVGGCRLGKAVYTAALKGNDWTYKAEFSYQDKE
jgi:hypothetical protein